MEKTIQGIHLDINPAVISDIMTLEMISDVMVPLPDDVSDEERSEGEAARIKAIFRLSRRIYGDEFDSVYQQLAEKHGGYVSADEWAQFLTETLNAYQKNDDARPAPGD